MRKIPLSNGMVALIDDADYESVSRHRWHAERRRNTWYARASINGKKLYMHRFIMNPSADVKIDHKDREGLNCQRSNLRSASISKNLFNQSRRKTHAGRPCLSEYKGVSFFVPGRNWRAYIGLNGKSLALGCYKNEIDAARAYDAAARFYFGEFACTNFPGSEALNVYEIRKRSRQERKAITASRYIGVVKATGNREKKWVATAQINKKQIHLGYYKTQEEAALAYDRYVIKQFGDKTMVNFPSAQ